MLLRVASRPSRFICKACRVSLNQSRKRKFGTNSITSNPEEIYDVVTVGGGPVGLALLTALKSSPATSHLKCALIEAQPLPKQKSWELPSDQYSNRASSITPTNQSFLEAIGAWRHLDLSRTQPYDEMQVWDAGNDASIQFDWKAEAVRYNAPLRTIATMVENANLSRALLRRLEELDAEDCLLSSTSVASIGNGIDDPEGLNLSTWPIISLKSSGTTDTSSPRQIAARLLIGADGINSPVRTFAGINTNGWDYNRHGVVATLKLEPTSDSPFSSSSDPNSALEDFLSDETGSSTTRQTNEPSTPSNRATAYQRFLPSLGGPIAILPLPDNHASLVWSTTPSIASTLKSLSPSAFVSTVNAALRLNQVDTKYMLSATTNNHESELNWRLQHTAPPSPTRPPPTIVGVQQGTIASFPLKLRNATSYISPRLALAGDAAHTIHPLAGQGLNLGLGDAESLARCVSSSVEHGADVGDLMRLEGYAKERYGRAVEMGGGVDALNGVYQLGGAGSVTGDGILGSVLSKARGLGMWVVGNVPGVKEGVMRRAG
ncbi:putative ubiquinone biosynthesis monooxygenase [Knufia obscura]|uniref:Ubiquinone biosynthesis monooxygenase COQ6, mitochondrial n=2 Tax=Knufia TaxID=430999 RepID=A0AAN8EZY0_9EURO|nr:putative ubiquinone biosynthesis monooxygenase [Knufia obscura]KAK5957526.1 putative ubiquinone biosynthesis monooxygenase [Knufia fluminis]